MEVSLLGMKHFLSLYLERYHQSCGDTAMPIRPCRPRMSHYIHFVEAELRHTKWQASNPSATDF